ncbi:MAG: oxygen-independent coproporphyrinogen-3 oxidase [Phenylobacterium sp.]|jgi:oxygen-independent coproporphyrinogen-3 oxidase
MWDQQLIEKYNITGPRYTSYPTALQFDETFTSIDLAKAITDLAPNQPVSLYLHIPFCHSICHYCACNKVITKNKQRAVEYLGYLAVEVEHMGKLVGNRPVSLMHWGGGTPTFLSDEQIVHVVKMLESAFNIQRKSQDQNHEFSIEIDPRTVGANTLSVLRELGFNRVSIGIQDFNPKVQEAVNRVQSEAMSRSVIEQSRELGYHSVNIDLIYGLPHQTPDTFARTVEQVIDIRPDRLSLFNYAHLPHRFKPQRRINNEDLPTAKQKLQIFQRSIEQLTAAGYHYIGMDHFALPDDELAKAQREGRLHRNFQGYTAHQENELIGLGVSAISQINGCYAQNHRDLYDYYESLDNGDLAIWRGCFSEDDDMVRQAVIMQLICHFTLSFDQVEQRFNLCFTDYFADELEDIRALEHDGLVTIKNNQITVTPIGRLLIRNVCMIFDAYLGGLATGNYSQAI